MSQTHHLNDISPSNIDDPLAPERPASTIRAEEMSELLVFEETIKQILVDGVFQAGSILRKIRDRKLYQPGHETFDDYLFIHWGWSYSHVHRIIDASIVVENLTTSPIGEVVFPTAESQVRPLVRLRDPNKQRAVWKKAVEIAEGRVPSARKVKDAILKIDPPPPKERVAKSVSIAPNLNQATPHGPVGGNHNVPARDDEYAFDHTGGEGKNAVEVTAAPIRVVVQDEDESSQDSDALPRTLPTVGENLASNAPNGVRDSNSRGEDDHQSTLTCTPPTLGPQPELPEAEDKVERPAEGEELDGDKGDIHVVVESPAACETGVENIKPFGRMRSSTIAPAAVENVEEPNINIPDTSLALGAVEEAGVGVSTVQSSARFVFADGTEVASTILLGSGEITPRLVQAGLGVVAHRSLALSPSKVSRQKYVVMLAEVLDQAAREKAGATAQHVLGDIQYAVFTLKNLLAKNKPNKGTRK